jgi:phage FluMu protein Com
MAFTEEPISVPFDRPLWEFSCRMAIADESPRPTEDVRCTYHPSVMTRLRCSRCGKPICPKCGVRTPVGLRCPECAGVRGLPTYRTETTSLAKAAGYGLAVALVIGVIWGYIPEWNFYLSLALGFGVAESMAKAAKGKRGSDLQALGIAMVILAIVLSRVVIAQRLGITWEMVNAFSKPVENALFLRPIPDGLFAALSVAIVWYRFR